MKQAVSGREALTRFFMREGNARELGQGAILQARRTAENRIRALEIYPALAPEGCLSILGVSDTTEALRNLRRWRRQKRILSVGVAGRACYPAFQLDPSTRRPYPVIKEILSEFGDDAGASWDAYLWFTLPNGLLNDRVPAEVLPTDPQAVLDAAGTEGSGFDA